MSRMFWSNRRAGMVLGVMSLALAGSSAQALQTPPPTQQGQQQPPPAGQPAQPQQADPLKFTHSGDLILLWQIKPDRTADFESAWQEIRGALAKNPNPDLQAFGKSFTVQKVNTPQGGPSIYVFVTQPVSTTYSYNPVTLLFETLKAPAPDPNAAAGTPPPAPPPGTFNYEQAQAIFKKLEGAYEAITPWPLQKMPW
jgi:hypothetical protein